MNGKKKKKRDQALRKRLYIIIFRADTPAGKLFDVILLILIVASVLVVMIDSIERFHLKYFHLLLALEWIFTIAFTIEYFVRIYSSTHRQRYITSFFGIIDLLAILPTYISLVLSGSQYLVVIRALRILRVFRIFKLGKFLRESAIIRQALMQSVPKITVFLVFVILSVTVIGSLMYFVEGGVNSGFSSIPKSIYWAIVTLTTVGYGDISPVTDIGQFLAAAVMIMGYAVLAVPTGIVSADLISTSMRVAQKEQQLLHCPGCQRIDHDEDARYCKHCGEKLELT